MPIIIGVAIGWRSQPFNLFYTASRNSELNQPSIDISVSWCEEIDD